MLIREITDVIERFAPLGWQESYDNAGLVVGRHDDDVHRALLAVDVTEEVLDEAEAEGCDLVITHHPLVFHALKRFNSADPVQRCVERAIRSRIAEAGFGTIDYVELCDAETLEPVTAVSRPARLLAAAWMGKARLIDNVPVIPAG